MGQSSLYCCFLFIQHQSMLDQAELKMRHKKKSGHSRYNRAQSTKGCYHFIT